MFYIPEDIITKAKQHGYAVFTDGNVVYKIEGKNKKGPFTIIAEVEEKVVGLTQNAEGGEHDVLKVEPEYRGMGIGEMLFALKTKLDGKRTHEWSQKYSRILFLIEHGYYPVATIDKIGGTMSPLEKNDRKGLCVKIKEARNASFQADDVDNLYYFELAPWRAYFLARKIKN